MGLPDHCETVVGEAELPRSGLDAGLKGRLYQAYTKSETALVARGLGGQSDCEAGFA